MTPDPSRARGGQTHGRRVWPTYVPCRAEEWCNATNGFDCRQPRRASDPLEIPSGPSHRNVTGKTPTTDLSSHIRAHMHTDHSYALHPVAHTLSSHPCTYTYTGRTTRPSQCTYIELEKDAISPYIYVQADTTQTRYARYTPLTPYDWDANPKWPWSAYNQTTPDKTEPWTWAQDRQVSRLHSVDQLALYMSRPVTG